MDQYVVVKQIFIAQTVINHPGSTLSLLPEKCSKTFSAMTIHLYNSFCKLRQH